MYSASSLDGPWGQPGGLGVRAGRAGGPGWPFFKQPPKGACLVLGPTRLSLSLIYKYSYYNPKRHTLYAVPGAVHPKPAGPLQTLNGIPLDAVPGPYTLNRRARPKP